MSSAIEHLIEHLTDPETQTLEIIGRNPDFGGPEYAIELIDFSPGEASMARTRYDGESLLDCLRQACEGEKIEAHYDPATDAPGVD